MSARPRTRKAPGASPAKARKAGRGPLRWLVLLAGGLWRNKAPGETAPALRIEPKGEAVAEEPISLLMQQRTELRARLLVHDPGTHVVRNLFVVHDELRASGWTAVEALPIKIVSRALTEAEIMAVDEPSQVLGTIIDTLRELKTAAEARVAEAALDRDWETLQVPEVSDTNFGEFELAERSWAGTVPNGLEIPLRPI
ncbi:MAG TPA: hypothetical protein VHM00_18530 [Caldimonas sp.]|jgi:hypothetical protein|nr:hypothetical protein [Caldimonas sp.]HEX2543064.1 hypothetical protein [Caldimonas sp.]